ncbi:MAG: hypothetical protein KDI56_09225, partial [Xanthomonadales bacterium]|nr:hypothetical protein [Xanthomonadales bacterium]
MVLLLSQVLFWLLLFLGERSVLPAGASYAPEIRMQRLAEDGAVLDAEPIAVPLLPAPAYRYRDDSGAGHARFEHVFEFPGGDTPWALYLSWNRRISEVRLNGRPITARAPLDIWSVLGGFDPVLYDLPAELLRPGSNQLEFQVYGVANKILPAFFVGELTPLFNAYAWAQLISVDLVVAAIGVMLFVALLCAITSWPASEAQRVRGLMGLLLLWSLRNFSFFGLDAGIPPPWRQVTHYSLT